MANDLYLYEQLAAEISGQIRQGGFRPGDRLPSVRQISLQKQISLSTVLQAYRMLEDHGLIEARPQSGYYVRLQRPSDALLRPEKPTFPAQPETVRIQNLGQQILKDASQAGVVQFGAALPTSELLPSQALNRIMARLARDDAAPPSQLGSPQGCLELRVQAARRAYLAGCTLSPEDLLITSGCTEALHLALRSVCKPGDLVAIETPTFFGILQILEALGLQALEIPCHPQEGMSLEHLEEAILDHTIRAVIVISNFSNPLGSCMPEANKHKLAQLLNTHQIALIEDDIYGELSFSDRRPTVIKAFDSNGGIILCSSFSKCLSPGLRVGWIAGGRWQNDIEQNKSSTNMFSPVLPQLTIAAFLASGGFEHVLRKMRRAYIQKTAQMADLVLLSFPETTRVSSPQGGFVLWVQMPETVDSLELYRQALKFGIVFAPGFLFSASGRYRNYLRLNAAYLSPQTEWAIKRLGELAKRIGGAIPRTQKPL